MLPPLMLLYVATFGSSFLPSSRPDRTFCVTTEVRGDGHTSPAHSLDTSLRLPTESPITAAVLLGGSPSSLSPCPHPKHHRCTQWAPAATFHPVTPTLEVPSWENK